MKGVLFEITVLRSFLEPVKRLTRLYIESSARWSGFCMLNHYCVAVCVVQKYSGRSAIMIHLTVHSMP